MRECLVRLVHRVLWAAIEHVCILVLNSLGLLLTLLFSAYVTRRTNVQKSCAQTRKICLDNNRHTMQLYAKWNFTLCILQMEVFFIVRLPPELLPVLELLE